MSIPRPGARTFVWWVFRKSLASSLIPKAAFTPTFARWFRDKGQWGNTPRPGAVVFFDFPNDRMHRISHVGLVEAVNSDGTITTIEGNTSSGLRSSQRDGDGVWRRRRRTGIVGCGYPAYGRRDLPPASLTAKSDKAGREDVNEASPAIVDLMSEDQKSLANGLMVLLGEVELLRPIAARKWTHKHDGDVDAEEWTVGELHFLEISVLAKADPDGAQRALHQRVVDGGLKLEEAQKPKTTLVLKYLTGAAD